MKMKTLVLAGWIGLVMVIGATASAEEKPKVRRFGQVIGIKKEKIPEYKKLHANTWPGVLKALVDSNIHNYSIYLKELPDGNHYLFAYYEYTGTDFDADMKKIGENPTVKKWWKQTDPCQVPLKNRAEGEWWSNMEEVYHSD